MLISFESIDCNHLNNFVYRENDIKLTVTIILKLSFDPCNLKYTLESGSTGDRIPGPPALI